VLFLNVLKQRYARWRSIVAYFEKKCWHTLTENLLGSRKQKSVHNLFGKLFWDFAIFKVFLSLFKSWEDNTLIYHWCRIISERRNISALCFRRTFERAKSIILTWFFFIRNFKAFSTWILKLNSKNTSFKMLKMTWKKS